MADAEDLGIELLPEDDEGIGVEADLASAEATAIGEDAPDPVLAEDVPTPIGMTWVFDFDRGEFVMHGHAPAEAWGLAAVRQYCLMAVHTARYANDVFTDDFGMEEPEDPIGEVVSDELIADYEDRLREALLVHDRIAGVQEFKAAFDQQTGTLNIEGFDVIMDDETLLTFGGIEIVVEGRD